MTNHQPLRLLGLFVVLLGFFLTANPLHAQTDSIDQWVESHMRERNVTGLALAILEGGRVVKAKGYGLANVEHGVPVTPSTVFQSASVGKQFTAAGILLLAQDGKLALDDPIGKYLPSSPKEWGGITIRHLLTHTSGIADYEEDSTWLDLRRDYTEEELLQAFARRPLLLAPGEEWAYSNPGYTLLGMIIRKVTGEHWGEFLRKRIFEPLGMGATRVISERDIVPNRAAGYELVEGELKNQEWVAPSWNTVAEGSLYLTVLDLAKWDAALYGNSLLSDASKKEMWSPLRLNDGSRASHGFGWFLIDEPNRRAVESDGSWLGFRSYIGRFSGDSLTIVMLANSSAALPILIGHKIAALYRPALAPQTPKAIRLKSKALAEYVGEYKLPTGEVFRVTRAENGLDVALGKMPLGSFEPASKDVFFMARSLESRLLFVRDERGSVRWLLPRRHPSWPTRAKKAG